MRPQMAKLRIPNLIEYRKMGIVVRRPSAALLRWCPSSTFRIYGKPTWSLRISVLQQPTTYMPALVFSLSVRRRFGQPVLLEPMISSVISPLAPRNRPIPPTMAMGPESG